MSNTTRLDRLYSLIKTMQNRLPYHERIKNKGYNIIVADAVAVAHSIKIFNN